MSTLQHRTFDYYAFGSQLPGRKYSAGSQYRYGFNGQEKDLEINGEGNITTADNWEYDSRVARRWNEDPVPKPYESSYLAFSGNPIVIADPSGADGIGDKEGNITATIYIRFDGDIDGGSMSIEEKQKYIDNVKNNIISTWNTFKTSDGKPVNANNVKVLEAPPGMTAGDLKSNENYVIVGNGLNAEDKVRKATQTSYTFGEKLNEGYFFYKNGKGGGEAAHEFGHMLGLSDRYAEGAEYEGFNNKKHGLQGRFTIPLMFDLSDDPTYNPYNNLMSRGTGLSGLQQDLIFDGVFNAEKVYESPCLILNIHDPDKKPEYTAIKATVKANKIMVTPYEGSSPILKWNGDYLQYIWKKTAIGTGAIEAAKCNQDKTKAANKEITDKYTH